MIKMTRFPSVKAVGLAAVLIAAAGGLYVSQAGAQPPAPAATPPAAATPAPARGAQPAAPPPSTFESMLTARAAKRTQPAGPALKGECPAGFQIKEGLNTGFTHEGMQRAFVVYPPVGGSGPAPVWVPLTGTIESTNQNLTRPQSGNNSELAKSGYLVLGPVRQCSNQNPDDTSPANCNGGGRNGWNWRPWNEGRASSAEGDKWKNDAGPDVRFLEAMVRCAATKWPVDSRRMYLGGISSGGTLTNRSLLFNSAFWAGGSPMSGEWYITKDDGSPLTFDQGREAMAASPNKIHQGRVGPFPLRATVSPMIVVTVWGGYTDTYSCPPLCADYRPSTMAGGNYFSAQKNVVHIACTHDRGHRWPNTNTDAFNLWLLNTMSSHPKGANPASFVMTPPPIGYTCRRGPYIDHYPTGPEAPAAAPAGRAN